MLSFFFFRFSVSSVSAKTTGDAAGRPLCSEGHFGHPGHINPRNGLLRTLCGFHWLSAPKSRDSLRLRRRFLPLPQKSRFFEAPRCAISSAKKIASESRFLLRRNWEKMVLTAEFPAIPSSAIKIASERRCAILVHSGFQKVLRRPVRGFPCTGCTETLSNCRATEDTLNT